LRHDLAKNPVSSARGFNRFHLPTFNDAQTDELASRAALKL